MPSNEDDRGYDCKSHHILLKHMPHTQQKKPLNRMNELFDTVKALCGPERFIWLLYMYGDSKESISNWCLRYAADRKIFTGGVLQWDLQNFTSCHSFLQRIKSDLLRSDPKFK